MPKFYCAKKKKRKKKQACFNRDQERPLPESFKGSSLSHKTPVCPYSMILRQGKLKCVISMPFHDERLMVAIPLQCLFIIQMPNM